MIRRALLLAALAAGASFVVVAEAPVVFADGDVNPIPEAQKLSEEAKEFEKVAGDGDADAGERKTARKSAYDKLHKAVDLLDAWLDKHPGDEERFDAFYTELKSRIFWIKKMAGVDEFTESGAVPAPQPTPPAPSPGNEPKTAPPAKPAPPTAAEALAEIESYGAKHKGDVPGLYEKYQDFLAKHPDPGAPEYAKAMAQVADLGKRLKDVYRLVHDDDPDSLKNADSAQTEKLVEQLLEDLDKGAPEIRVRAARYLGALGSGKAADPLVKVLKKEKSGAVFDAAAEALGKIGGKRVCDRLLKVGADPDLQNAVIDILTTILGRGGAEGRVAGEALGGYAETVAPDKRAPIFDALSNAGPTGALGLARALPAAPVGDVSKLVDKLRDAGDPRVVLYVAKLMVANASGAKADAAASAREAIEKIGKPGVRYLIPNLDDATVSVWTAEMLHRITGQKLKDDKRKTWETWFRANRKAMEGK